MSLPKTISKLTSINSPAFMPFLLFVCAANIFCVIVIPIYITSPSLLMLWAILLSALIYPFMLASTTSVLMPLPLYVLPALEILILASPCASLPSEIALSL